MFFRFPPFVIVWCRGPSSLSWSRCLKRISNRDRMAAEQSQLRCDGYRPKRTAHQAVHRVAEAIAKAKTRVIDIDLRAYFDNVKHHLLLEKIARRIQDGDVLHLLKLILKATGKQGVPQGGVISPLISNVYLNEVDQMLEKAIEVTRYGKQKQFTVVQYARFADEMTW